MLLILDSAIIVCETNHELKCLKSEALILLSPPLGRTPAVRTPLGKDPCGEGSLRDKDTGSPTYCHLYVGRSLDSDSA